MIGPGPYKLLQSLLTPDKPSDKTFEELTALLSKHYSPPPSEVIQRYRFNSRSRNAGESIAAYVADLRRLAEFCNFGTTLEKMLRDRIVYGVNCEGIQRKLLAERELTYEWDLAISQGSEEADRNLREMRISKSKPTPSVVIKQEPVNQLSASSTTPKKRNSGGKSQATPTNACYQCDGTGHRADDCRFKEVKCNHCRKKGHIAKACRSRDKPPGAKPVQRVSEGDTEEDPIEPLMAVQSTGKYTSPLEVRVLIDNCSLPMELDMGASRSVISENKFRQLWPDRKLESSTVRLQKYSQEPLSIMGQVDVTVEYNGENATLPLLVVKGNGPPLFGRDWMSVIRVNWTKIHYTPSTGLQGLLEQYSDVFKDSLGTSVGRKAKIEVNPSAQPRYCKARTLPYAMRPRVEEELERLVTEGILEPVAHSEWATLKVATLKSDKKTIRLCGDFHMTVNPIAKLDQYPVSRVEDLFATLTQG